MSKREREATNLFDNVTTIDNSNHHNNKKQKKQLTNYYEGIITTLLPFVNRPAPSAQAE